MTTVNNQFKKLVEVILAEKTEDWWQKTTTIFRKKIMDELSYVGINKEDFYNENFTCDVYLLVTKNLNPFLLDRKLND